MIRVVGGMGRKIKATPKTREGKGVFQIENGNMKKGRPFSIRKKKSPICTGKTGALRKKDLKFSRKLVRHLRRSKEKGKTGEQKRKGGAGKEQYT